MQNGFFWQRSMDIIPSKSILKISEINGEILENYYDETIFEAHSYKPVTLIPQWQVLYTPPHRTKKNGTKPPPLASFPTICTFPQKFS